MAHVIHTDMHQGENKTTHSIPLYGLFDRESIEAFTIIPTTKGYITTLHFLNTHIDLHC